MRQVYPVIFTPLNDKKDTVLIEVPDWEILTEGYGMADGSGNGKGCNRSKRNNL